MKTLTNTLFIATALASMILVSDRACAVAPTLIGTFTVDVSKLKDAIVFAGCSKIVTLPPDADTIDIYDDYTFTETVTVSAVPTYIYGFWNQVDGAKWSKFRFTLTGNAGEGTGSWGTYLNNMQTVADNACGGLGVNAFGGTLRLLKGDLYIKTSVPHSGTGTAQAAFRTEMYGYDVFFDKIGKGTENRISTGTFTWY